MFIVYGRYVVSLKRIRKKCAKIIDEGKEGKELKELKELKEFRSTFHLSPSSKILHSLGDFDA